MKKAIILVMLCGCFQCSFGQSVFRSVIGNGATNATEGTIQILGTVGQPVTGHLESTEIKNWQGFWEHWDFMVYSGDYEPIPGQDGVELGQSYPNPFVSQVFIPLKIFQDVNVRLSIYNLVGQELEILYDGLLYPGTYLFQTSSNNWAPGMFYYKIEVNHNQVVKKMLKIN